MKTFLKLFTLALIPFLFYACDEALVEEQIAEEVTLKSAQNAKTSYVVFLNDAELNMELSSLKGYEKRQQAAQKAAEKVMKRAGVTDGEIELVYGTAVKGFAAKIPPGQLKKLEKDPSVLAIKEDKIVTLVHPMAKPGDADVSISATQSIPWGITRVNGGADGTGKTAWVIDTGIDLDHPDLNVDTERSKTFVSKTSSADDDNGHGSHVAGTIAAKNNDIGVIGVAAGATVVAVKVLDRRGDGYYSWIIGGIDYVAANGSAGDVANMSLGGSYDKALNDAVIAAAQAGIKFSLAAGNEGTDANTKSPASANHQNIYTISAMDSNDNFAYFSNYSNPPVDYCQPGVSIYSCYRRGGYTTMSGTSMAAPHMAGLLLLGQTKTDGYVNGDPDGSADPILVYSGTVTPPENKAPTANFTFQANNLTVTFTDASSDSDGTISSWSWNFGDGNYSTDKNPTHTYSLPGSYQVALTVTDDDNTTNTKQQTVTVAESPGGSITLSATLRKVKGEKFVDLSWNGAEGSEITIKVDGATYSVVANDGSETISFGKSRGAVSFAICETDESGCSNEVMLNL
ncbi:S8 family serine peptidase [Mariniphaga anaerophila]|nr:S8 family serine peptidase [Mariniphaga anaerophila]